VHDLHGVVVAWHALVVGHDVDCGWGRAGGPAGEGGEVRGRGCSRTCTAGLAPTAGLAAGQAGV
jgi:hypothetical protein